MKNRLISVTIAVILVLSTLTACGKKAPEPPAPPQSETEIGSASEATEPAPESSTQKENELSSEKEPEEAVLEEEPSDKPSDMPEIVLLKKGDYKFSDDGKYKGLFWGEFASPLLSEDSAESYPELAAAMEKMSQKELDAYKKSCDEYISQVTEMYDESNGEFFGNCYLRQWVKVERVDDKVVSFFLPFDEYMGGAHGINGRGFATFDTATGKELKLADVLTSLTDLPAILQSEIEKKYADHLDGFFDLEENLSHFTDGGSGQNEADDEDPSWDYTWALTDEGVEFYFGPYELASYATGDQRVLLKYDEYPELFKNDYFPAENAGNRGNIDKFYYSYDEYDVDGDGKKDEFTVEKLYGGEDPDEATGLQLVLNDKTEIIDTTDIELIDNVLVDNYYVHTPDGRSYIYVIVGELNDFYSMFVFDVSDGNIKNTGRMHFTYPEWGFEDDNSCKTYFLYDPDRFCLGDRFSIICTFTGSKYYHVGDDGMPVTDDKEYIITSTVAFKPIKCVKDFECTFIDEDGKTSTDTVRSGETFELLKTDGESYIIAKISDGRLVKLDIDGQGMEMKVNGINAEDLFEALMYAG